MTTPLENLKSRIARAHEPNFSWEEGKHPRAKDGEWTSGQSGAGASPAKQPSRAKRIGKAALHAPLHVEHWAKKTAKGAIDYVGNLWKDSGSGWDKESKPINPESIAGKTIKGVKMAGSAILKTSFLPWIAGEKAVEGVARAKGMSNEDAAKLRTLVTCYDALNCKAITLGLHMAGMPVAAGASVWFPTASMAYLAHAAVSDHKAVIKAASVGIQKAAKHLGLESLAMPAAAYFSADDGGNVNARATMAVGVLADAIKKHSGSDWYFALLAHAMDHAKNAAQAVKLADVAFNQSGGQAGQ